MEPPLRPGSRERPEKNSRCPDPDRSFVSAKTARKYFGNEDPPGKVLRDDIVNVSGDLSVGAGGIGKSREKPEIGIKKGGSGSRLLGRKREQASRAEAGAEAG